jgi:hypothetical protein
LGDKTLTVTGGEGCSPCPSSLCPPATNRIAVKAVALATTAHIRVLRLITQKRVSHFAQRYGDCKRWDAASSSLKKERLTFKLRHAGHRFMNRDVPGK